MRAYRWGLKAQAAWIAMIAALLAYASTNGGSSNCGGNSEALHHVRQGYLILWSAAQAQPERPLSADERTELAWISQSDPAGRYLVSRLPFDGLRASGPKRILMVCTRAFTNQPRRGWFPAPPSHAASYTDGSTRLISPEGFAALDRSALVPLEGFLGSLPP